MANNASALASLEETLDLYFGQKAPACRRMSRNVVSSRLDHARLPIPAGRVMSWPGAMAAPCVYRWTGTGVAYVNRTR